MILLHVSDLHFNHRWYRWLEESAPHHDVLVVSVDLLDLAHPSYPSEQASWVSDWIAEYPKPLCICSGKHDLEWDPLADTWRAAQWLHSLSSREVAIDGDRMTMEGVSILSVGVMNPAYASADIWVKHQPPSGTAVAALPPGDDRGEIASPLWSIAQRPSLVLCGHVHSPARWQCVSRGVQFVNPGHNRAGRFPNHVIIDLEEHCLIHVADHPTGARCSSAKLASLQTRAF